ncbi:MAG: TerB family tellurite resistance protein [Pseudomonadota bacterium]
MQIAVIIAGLAAALLLGSPLARLLPDASARFLGRFAPDRAKRRSVTFTIALVALSAKMAKADGVVTQSEADAFRDLLDVPDEDLDNLRRVFDLTKHDVAGFDGYARQIRDLFKDEPALLEDVLDGLFHIAKADGAVHEAELVYLEMVADIFGFDPQAFLRIKARHVHDGPLNPYLVLGVHESMAFDDIRRAYRTLVQEHHPDRMIARGVPEEAIRIATERLQAINEAYAEIERLRNRPAAE